MADHLLKACLRGKAHGGRWGRGDGGPAGQGAAAQAGQWAARPPCACRDTETLREVGVPPRTAQEGVQCESRSLLCSQPLQERLSVSS